MRWKFTLHSKITGRLHNSTPEKFLPYSVDENSCRYRIFLIEHPICKSESILRNVDSIKWKYTLRHAECNLISVDIVRATFQQICWTNFAAVFHDHDRHRIFF